MNTSVDAAIERIEAIPLLGRPLADATATWLGLLDAFNLASARYLTATSRPARPDPAPVEAPTEDRRAA